ncbi:MAG: TIGR03768 family metallophosphoesterase [Rhodoferax sp.]
MNHSIHSGAFSRRDILKYSAGTFAAASVGSLTFGCGGGSSGGAQLQPYPIDSANVRTTQQRMIAFPATPPGAVATPLPLQNLNQVASYSKLGYGNWTFGSGLPIAPRYELMPSPYRNPAPVRNAKFANFFAFTDIHITDKEAPNQFIYMQQFDSGSYNNTSIYSPVMMCTTQVLDAAIQTANALHKQNPFDFGISLGDTCNNTSYNELRWYMDVIDGKPITPSSGAHAGAETIDYQKPYQAVGLDKSIPWYQAMGNHDHFFIGSFPVDADPSLGIRKSYVSDTIWNVADVLNIPFPPVNFPAMFNMENLKGTPSYYMGTLNGATPYGEILYTGITTDPKFSAGAPKVVADPDRRSLQRTEWVQEFFNTTSTPVGHGFNLVDKTDPNWHDNGFTCYSFMPNVKMPLKIIVLDNTQSEHDGSTDIHGHGYLDARRWAWLRAELAAGQAENQLMIIAAHVPIGVSAIASETEWWAATDNITPENQNAVNLTGLISTLQATPNLLAWIAGHRHLNAIKAFKSLDSTKPWQGFWQVETSSLRDFPQQFRTFQVYLNSDYTVSIVTTNVDPAVADGTPAAASRKYAIAAQQIVKAEVTLSNPNVASLCTGFDAKNNAILTPLDTIDPTQNQAGYVLPADNYGLPKGSLMGATRDPTILYENMADTSRYSLPVQVNGSCNAELFKQLSPQMVSLLKTMFPQAS